MELLVQICCCLLFSSRLALFVSEKLRWAALRCGVVTALQAGPALIFRGGATYVKVNNSLNVASVIGGKQM